MPRPVGIDLFAGVGGMSLGFEQAGFDVKAAVEIDPVHALAHKYNFPNCETIAKSVSELTGDEIRNRANLNANQTVHVVFGGAPCQGFSLIGQRALDDPRNNLVLDFLRLVAELNASYFVFENVRGLTVGKHKKFLSELVHAADAAGYDVVTPWRVLNAYNYGVPQDRQRLFLLGKRRENGIATPQYPLPSTSPPGCAVQEDLDLDIGPSCHDALNDLPDADEFDELIKNDAVQVRPEPTCSTYAREMRCAVREDWHYGYVRHWNSDLLTASLRTRHTHISRRRFYETEPGDVEPVSRFFKLPQHGVSNTLRAGTDSSRGAFTSPRPIHYLYPRCVTVREMLRLHGFPDWFRTHITKWHGARQVGNAVPPPLARAVATSIRNAIELGFELNLRRPHVRLNLGDAAMLSVDVTKASELLGIDNPISKRNVKSGVRKRRQAEIEAEREALRQAMHYP